MLAALVAAVVISAMPSPTPSAAPFDIFQEDYPIPTAHSGARRIVGVPDWRKAHCAAWFTEPNVGKVGCLE